MAAEEDLRAATAEKGSTRLEQKLGAHQAVKVDLKFFKAECDKRRLTEEGLRRAFGSPSADALRLAIKDAQEQQVSVNLQEFEEELQRREVEEKQAQQFIVMEPVDIKTKADLSSNVLFRLVPQYTKLKVVELKENGTKIYGKVTRNQNPGLQMAKDGWILLHETQRPFRHWVSRLTTSSIRTFENRYFEGKKLMEGDMSVAEARAHVAGRPDVSGFHHVGGPNAFGKVKISFFSGPLVQKAPWSTWTAYEVTWE